MPGLIPHRVDRQLAAAARPLLFVRPRIKDDQPRRRKRRCLSTNPGSTSVGTPVDTPADIMSAVPLPVLSLGEDGQTNLQWQRISEQRRRDAMRENFDLLKRMLPQEYMTSDDGRELARPVLLARFLRWVDDTLIEMENLKSEVAQLKMQQMQQMQQQSSAAPIGSQQGNCGWEGQASDAAPQQINDSSPMWEVAEAVAVAAAAAAATATATTASSSSSEGDTAESSHMQGQPPTQTVTPASDVRSQLLGDL
ncbi:hypothetical protein FBU59_005483 [Linderina macrospora]|uniref:Uncharacterized protein n=1 Tax=Linderina macrospora TaxID=4868 RepID=A0ACC1J2P7_9FUNG|nr:hypothetical protein FBU59_005483 [Linderina macrospora]